MSQMMDVMELRPHSLNAYFFDDITGEAWDEFLKSIQTSGIIEPLVISQNKTIVSGHQRYRAAKELGLESVPVEVRIYDDGDELLKQLIETNIRQRGLGNGNPVKLGRCLKELERISGVRDGSANELGNNRIGDGNNFRHQFGEDKTQVSLAEELGMSARTIRNYKALADATPALQEAIEVGKVTATSALGIIRGMSTEEQDEIARQLLERDGRATGKDVDALMRQVRDLKVSEQVARDAVDLLTGQVKKLERERGMEEERRRKEIEKNDTKWQAAVDAKVSIINSLGEELEELKKAKAVTVEVEKVPEDYQELKSEVERLRASEGEGSEEKALAAELAHFVAACHRIADEMKVYKTLADNAKGLSPDDLQSLRDNCNTLWMSVLEFRDAVCDSIYDYGTNDELELYGDEDEDEDGEDEDDSPIPVPEPISFTAGVIQDMSEPDDGGRP